MYVCEWVNIRNRIKYNALSHEVHLGVCVCMCVYVCVFVCVFVYVCMCVWAYILNTQGVVFVQVLQAYAFVGMDTIVCI